jgi:cytochrome c oxidase subunit 1
MSIATTSGDGNFGGGPHGVLLADGEYAMPERHYLNADYGWKSWLFTLDHKRIALLYLFAITIMFALGGFAAMIVRLNLLTPNSQFVPPQAYNKMFTMHGVVMVFFFLIPSIPAVMGNFLVPMMIGARDLAFPKVNLLSWYLYMVGGVIGLIALTAGGVDTGWTMYAPLSTKYSYGPVALAIVGIFLAGFSSILTGLNFIVTVHKMRAPGLTWFRLPLFIWSMYATSLIQILGTPVLAITLLLLFVEKVAGVGVFDPKLGGDPILMQHLFWFYSHPAVYIMILPSMAVVSEIIACFSRRAVFGYKMVAFASLGIAILGFLVWGHHMYTTTQSPYASMVFSLLSFLVAIPSAIKVFNWTATLYKGSIRITTPMLYALGFIGLFTVGGLTGLHLASLAIDIHLQDTYFVIAHFHYIMVGGAMMGFMGSIHFWWPKVTGRMYSEVWGKVAAIVLFLGFNLTFFPQFILGYDGMPRRYAMYAPEYQMLNVMSTAGASIMALGYLMPGFYLIASLFRGKVAGPNPWKATGLEWQCASPPTTFNFDRTPIVTHGPYAYAPDADELDAAKADLRRAEIELALTRADFEAHREIAHLEDAKKEETRSGV